MKKIIFLVSCLFISVFSFAQTKTHNFEIGYEISNYKYTEPGTMNLKSPNKQGINVIYTHTAADTGYLWGIDFHYLQGDVDYDGATWGGTPLTLENLRDYYFDAQIQTGRHYVLGEHSSLAAYTGLGFRKLRNHLEEGGPSGYLRQSTYLYLPLGVRWTYSIPNAWSFRLAGEFDCLIRGTQISDFDGDEVENEQTSGFGVRLGFKVERKLGVMGLFVEPFFRYWDIAQSDTVRVFIPGEGYTGLIEPRNRTREYGIRAGISF